MERINSIKVSVEIDSNKQTYSFETSSLEEAIWEYNAVISSNNLNLDKLYLEIDNTGEFPIASSDESL